MLLLEILGGENIKFTHSATHSSIIHLLSASIVLVSGVLLGGRDTKIKETVFSFRELAVSYKDIDECEQMIMTYDWC